VRATFRRSPTGTDDAQGERRGDKLTTLPRADSLSLRLRFVEPGFFVHQPKRVVKSAFDPVIDFSPRGAGVIKRVELRQIMKTSECKNFEEALRRHPRDGRAGLRAAGARGDHAEAFQAAENVAADIVTDEPLECAPCDRLPIGDTLSLSLSLSLSLAPAPRRSVGCPIATASKGTGRAQWRRIAMARYCDFHLPYAYRNSGPTDSRHHFVRMSSFFLVSATGLEPGTP
jgi:hypothetical protein